MRERERERESWVGIHKKTNKIKYCIIRKFKFLGMGTQRRLEDSDAYFNLELIEIMSNP